VFETGDEMFLRLDLKAFARSPRHCCIHSIQSITNIKAIIEEEAEFSTFQTICLRPLIEHNPKLKWAKVSNADRYRNTCTDLVHTTSNLFRRHNQAWFLSVVSQRMHADLKIKASIQLDMKKYWVDHLAASSHFDGVPLRQCLNFRICSKFGTLGMPI